MYFELEAKLPISVLFETFLLQKQITDSCLIIRYYQL